MSKMTMRDWVNAMRKAHEEDKQRAERERQQNAKKADENWEFFVNEMSSVMDERVCNKTVRESFWCAFPGMSRGYDGYGHRGADEHLSIGESSYYRHADGIEVRTGLYSRKVIPVDAALLVLARQIANNSWYADA